MENINTRLSVIICTYNRDYILSDCLDSLVNQTADKSLYEVIVVNNNSTDRTQEIALEYVKNDSNFRVVCESNQGLSYARNRGYFEAQYEWVAYVDDDAKADTSFVDRAFSTIEKYKFDCFGGMYYPWYRNSVRPKWLSETFGQSTKFYEEVTVLTNGYVSGGVCVYKKSALYSIGGFPLDLGMTGTKIAYGEETYVQNKLVENGFTIGFDPALCIVHLVPEYKQTLKWHIKAAYAHGRDSVKIFGMAKQNITLIKYCKITMKMVVYNIGGSIVKIMSIKGYYWQNLVLDIIKPLASFNGYYFEYNKRQKNK
ncbi:MAG: glycosyltransferase family 2 protein [Paludibacter sp.]|nr:glycosyltransferase family 2 protein [Paludibacter sp.]